VPLELDMSECGIRAMCGGDDEKMLVSSLLCTPIVMQTNPDAYKHLGKEDRILINFFQSPRKRWYSSPLLHFVFGVGPKISGAVE
jgi:hypothetical protein